ISLGPYAAGGLCAGGGGAVDEVAGGGAGWLVVFELGAEALDVLAGAEVVPREVEVFEGCPPGFWVTATVVALPELGAPAPPGFTGAAGEPGAELLLVEVGALLDDVLLESPPPDGNDPPTAFTPPANGSPTLVEPFVAGWSFPPP